MAPNRDTPHATDAKESFLEGKSLVEARLMSIVHEKASRASSETAFILGQIIEAMGLSTRYRDYAKETGSKPVSLKGLGHAGNHSHQELS